MPANTINPVAAHLQAEQHTSSNKQHPKNLGQPLHDANDAAVSNTICICLSVLKATGCCSTPFTKNNGWLTYLSLHSPCAVSLLCASFVKCLKQLHVLQQTTLVSDFCDLLDQMTQGSKAFFWALNFSSLGLTSGHTSDSQSGTTKLGSLFLQHCSSSATWMYLHS